MVNLHKDARAVEHAKCAYERAPRTKHTQPCLPPAVGEVVVVRARCGPRQRECRNRGCQGYACGGIKSFQLVLMLWLHGRAECCRHPLHVVLAGCEICRARCGVDGEFRFLASRLRADHCMAGHYGFDASGDIERQSCGIVWATPLSKCACSVMSSMNLPIEEAQKTK